MSYAIDDETWIEGCGRWENRRFRLEDDVLGLGSVIEETAIPVYLHLRRAARGNGLSLDLSAGAIVGREFDIEDRDGAQRDHGRRRCRVLRIGRVSVRLEVEKDDSTDCDLWAA
ncbi:MAG: hypothetical protein HND57_11215 [Planctomycetes bacterium]|nr:hypothetical protein [Planctomycetota bacterium]